MGEKCEVTFILDFRQVYQKQGKSGKYEKVMWMVAKTFNQFFKRLQKKHTIDYYTALQNGDTFEVWIVADRNILEDMVKQFNSNPKTDDKEDRDLFKTIRQLKSMFRNIISFSEITPISEVRK